MPTIEQAVRVLKVMESLLKHVKGDPVSSKRLSRQTTAHCANDVILLANDCISLYVFPCCQVFPAHVSQFADGMLRFDWPTSSNAQSIPYIMRMKLTHAEDFVEECKKMVSALKRNKLLRQPCLYGMILHSHLASSMLVSAFCVQISIVHHHLWNVLVDKEGEDSSLQKFLISDDEQGYAVMLNLASAARYFLAILDGIGDQFANLRSATFPKSELREFFHTFAEYSTLVRAFVHAIKRIYFSGSDSGSTPTTSLLSGILKRGRTIIDGIIKTNQSKKLKFTHNARDRLQVTHSTNSYSSSYFILHIP